MIRVCLLLLAVASIAQARPRLYGLVIGYNGTDDAEQSPLRYADDDAVKNAQLLGDLGAHVVLLSELDSETRALHPAVPTAPPTRAALDAAVDELNRRMQADNEESHLFLFYSGHGDVYYNEGHVQLSGERLRRDEFRQLLGRTRADQVHVIVDACKAYFLVFERGPGGERRPTRAELPSGLRELPPNVGVLLSSSSGQETHEWEAFQAGVFSHEVRSALRGAADLNQDGVISYEEVASFVFAANRMIPNARYRPALYARAPAGGPLASAALVDPPASPMLSLGPDMQRHLYVEDARGNRLADLHPSGELTVSLLLPAERPLFVREARGSSEYRLEEHGSALLEDLSPARSQAQARGAEHQAFSLLFDQPFTSSDVEAYWAAVTEARQQIRTQSLPTWVRPSLAVAAGVFAAAGGTLTALAASERGGIHRRSSNLERVRTNQRVDGYNAGAITLYTLATMSLTAFTVWTFWPQEEIAVQVIGPSVTVEGRF